MLARVQSSNASVPWFVLCCILLWYNRYRARCSLTQLHFSIRVSFKKSYIPLLNINLFISRALPCVQKPTEASAEWHASVTTHAWSLNNHVCSTIQTTMTHSTHHLTSVRSWNYASRFMHFRVRGSQKQRLKGGELREAQFDVHCRIHNSPQPVLILSQIKPVPVLSDFLQIHFNIFSIYA